MIALDSSVVIAGFGTWHEHHERAVEVLRRTPRLPAHAALEAYSVLTRLPDPFRAEPAELVTLDERALATYERCGVQARLLS